MGIFRRCIYKIEEKLVMIPLTCRIIKYSFFYDKDIKFEEFKYGENIKQYYRVYKGRDKNKPILYFIHGGGWWHGSPRMCSCIGKYFNKLGYTVVLPAYRLLPLYKYPNQIHDVFMALKNCISKDENNKNNNIIVIGFSAGGELAANLVFNKVMQQRFDIDSSILKGMISLAGVLDFEKCISRHSKTLIRNYIGRNNNFVDENPINLIENSPKVPVLCVHGERDTLINIENSISFIDKINKKNGFGIVKKIKRKHHSDIIGLIIGKKEKGSDLILDFIKTYE